MPLTNSNPTNFAEGYTPAARYSPSNYEISSSHHKRAFLICAVIRGCEPRKKAWLRTTRATIIRLRPRERVPSRTRRRSGQSRDKSSQKDRCGAEQRDKVLQGLLEGRALTPLRHSEVEVSTRGLQEEDEIAYTIVLRSRAKGSYRQLVHRALIIHIGEDRDGVCIDDQQQIGCIGGTHIHTQREEIARESDIESLNPWLITTME